MKLIIFGAANPIGRRLTIQALENHHKVTAFYREPDVLNVNDDHLAHISGDVLHYPAVERAVIGHDAAVLTLGKWGRCPSSNMMSVATRHVIHALAVHGIDRLLVILSGGEYAPTPDILGSPMYAEHLRQLIALERSGLHWTAIHPPIEPSRALQQGRLHQLARFTLEQLSSPRHVGRVVKSPLR